jgi:hypothetical protein
MSPHNQPGPDPCTLSDPDPRYAAKSMGCTQQTPWAC